MTRQHLILGAAVMLLSFAGFSCSRYDTNPAEVPDPVNDEPLAESTTDPQAPADAQAVSTAEPAAADQNADQASEPTDRDPVAADVQTKQVVLAGGCFWCVEAVYEMLDGVHDVESGYAGGSAETANYRAVSTGQTKHAEVVRITYDPSKITYGRILKIFFSTAHDPTTLNRQGADVGPQYRSAIFYANETERKIAADYIKQLNDAEVYSDPIVTTLEPLEKFYAAETYHQDYAKQNPNDGYIRGVSDPKVDKTRKAYPELLKDDEKKQ